MVRVPAIFAIAERVPDCYRFRSEVPAGCAEAFSRRSGTARVATRAGSYPPLYYGVVGIPSLFAPSVTGVYLMRLVSAVLAAALLASALASTRRPGRRAVTLPFGVALAVTPMVLYGSGSVNPSGLEIAAALCVWASGLALVTGVGARPNARLVARTGVAAAVLALSRPTSPLWLALIGLTLLAVARREAILRLWRRREVRAWLGIVVGAGVLATLWILLAGALHVHSIGEPIPLPVSEALRATMGKTHLTVREMIGNFGWLDTPAPTYTIFVWLMGLGFVVVGGLLVAARRDLAVLVGLLIAAVVVPVLLEARSVSEKGLIWQGRYTLPLAVGVPILAAFAATRAADEDAPPSASRSMVP